MHTKFYQNRLAFVEDMTKIFWCVFIGSQCREGDVVVLHILLC